MTNIDGVRFGLAGIARAGRPGRRGPGTAFASHAGAEETEAPALPAAAHLAGLDGLLALQEVRVDQLCDREARRHGHTLLGALGRLQIALLSPEGIDTADLTRLVALVDTTPRAADRRLHETLGAIVLRAKVELVKREVRQPG